MNRPPKCQRCPRDGTYAVAVEAGVLVLCRRHAEQVAAVLEADPIVVIGRRRVRLDVPALEAVVR